MASPYKVDVIFFSNPHQIWVAVQKPEGELCFEQIGVYGVLPMKPSLDLIEGGIKSSKTKEWMSGVVSMMRNLLEDIKVVYFCPVHIERTSSIFKNHDIPHKFGELTIVDDKGKRYKLSKLLVKSSFATYDETEFLKELKNGNIKPKLSEKRIAEIKDILRKYRATKIKSKRKTLGTLTVESLAYHNMNIEKSDTGDLEESDEEQLGRACRSRDLTKKLKCQRSVLNTEIINEYTVTQPRSKISTETNEDSAPNSTMSKSSNNTKESPDKPNSLLLRKKLMIAKESWKDGSQKQGSVQDQFVATKSTFQDMKKDNTTEVTIEKEHKTPKLEEEEDWNYSKESTHETWVQENSPINKDVMFDVVKKPKKPKKANKNKPIAFDGNTQACVIYGPDTDMNTLPRHIVPKERFDKASSLKQILNITEDDGSNDQEDFNRDVLKPTTKNYQEDFNREVLKPKLKEYQEDSDQEVLKPKMKDYQEDSDQELPKPTMKYKQPTTKDYRKDFDQEILKPKLKDYQEDSDQELPKPTIEYKQPTTKNYRKDFDQEVLKPKLKEYQEDSDQEVLKPKLKDYQEDFDQEVLKLTMKDKQPTMKDYRKDFDQKILTPTMKEYRKDFDQELLKPTMKNYQEDFDQEVLKPTMKVKPDIDETFDSSKETKRVQPELKRIVVRETFSTGTSKKSDNFSEPVKSPKKAVSKSLLIEVDNVVKTSNNTKRNVSKVLRKRLEIHKVNSSKLDSSVSTVSDTTFEDSLSSSGVFKKTAPEKKMLDSDDESVSEILEKINIEYPKPLITPEKEKYVAEVIQNNVNPFKNIDPNISVFVDKLVTPVLMVHSKLDKRFEPVFKISEINFNTHIQMRIELRNIHVEQPMTLQSVSWFSILRGYSTFLISPKGSGKTMGYLPAVCSLVADNDCVIPGNGPLSIIVCATAMSVAFVERLAKLFLHRHKVFACYSGMNEIDLITSLLNGCDLLITTPSLLVRLLQSNEFGVDLSRLSTFVLDDCERLAEVYGTEIKFFLVKIKEMLRNRTVKELKVQFIVASRIWTDFMEQLAKKAPDTVVCIGAFQECVLYSKASTTATFLPKDKKTKSVLEFVRETDRRKRTVVVCREDHEVEEIKKVLTEAKYTVFTCNNTMTVNDLYNISMAWNEYRESSSSPIMVCCDENLTHMNITDCHYLVHYSLPILFSSYCKRFSVLNDNYASIFKEEESNVKIKMILEEENTEQLPKILNFIKRCTDDVPEVLEKISAMVLSRKELAKAERMIPVCENLLGLGECPDFWNCQDRHELSKKHDEPADWVPINGLITFQIVHYHSAVLYSARLLTHVNGVQTRKYPQNYNTLSMKISMYYSKESNRKLHGYPEVGDIAAVCISQNFFHRCQVVRILGYEKGKPKHVLVRLIDEERLERTRDVYLYYLPDHLRGVESYVIKVRLANIQPKDKDITFSKLAMEQLQKITETDPDLYARSRVVLTIGNCIFVDKLEMCKDLSVTNQTIVRHDFRQELSAHGIDNPEHLEKLKKICEDCNIKTATEELIQEIKPIKKVYEPQWAHLEKDDLSLVLFSFALDPGTFFVRLVKFEDSCNRLVKEIEKYVENNPEPVTDVSVGDIVLAKFPGSSYERARIDEVSRNKVKCFFVDQGDWIDVSVQDLAPIPEKFVSQMPFQAIECRLYGVKPVTEEWTDFSTTWLMNQFQDDMDDLKQLYVQYHTKEKACYTGGNKYAVVVFDTTKEKEVIVNKMIVEVNLARPIDEEFTKLDEIVSNGKMNLRSSPESTQDSDNDDDKSWENVPSNPTTPEIMTPPKISFNDLFPKKPIRSMTIDMDCNSESSDEKWQISNVEDFLGLLKPVNNSFKGELPAIENAPRISSENTKHVASIEKPDILQTTPNISNITDTGGSQSQESHAENASETTLKKINSPEKKLTKKDDSIISRSDKITRMDSLMTDDSSDTSSFLEKITKPKSDDDMGDCNEKKYKDFCIVSQDVNLLDSDDFSSSDNTDSESEKDSEILDKRKKIVELEQKSPKNSEIPEKQKIVELEIDSTKKSEIIEKQKKIVELELKPTKYSKVLDKQQKIVQLELKSTKNSDIPEKQKKIVESELQSTKNSAILEKQKKIVELELRKPKLCWRQKKDIVNIKILLIGVDKYQLEIRERAIEFEANVNDVQYRFDLELYGVIDREKSSHENKGQYILVRLVKVLKRNWLTLTRSGLQKWIVYDVDAIDTSSDEEECSGVVTKDMLRNICNQYSESEDEHFVDDATFSYNK